MRRRSGLLPLIACLFVALFFAPAPHGPFLGSSGVEVQRFLWNNNVQFHWDIAAGVDYYNIYRGDMAGVRLGNYGSWTRRGRPPPRQATPPILHWAASILT